MIIIFVCCAAGIIWAIFNMFLVTNIDVEKGTKVDDNEEGVEITHKHKKMLMELGEKISEVSLDIFRVLMLF